MLEQFPANIQAGLTFRAELVLPEFPAPAWSVQAIFRGPAAFEIAAVGDGDVHSFAASPATTTAWAAGSYMVSIRASDGTDVLEIEAGRATIAADLAAAEIGHDPRAHAEKVLAAIEAVIEGRATKDQQGYTIGNRTLQRTPLGDLLALRATYRREVRRLQDGRTRILGRKVKARFV